MIPAVLVLVAIAVAAIVVYNGLVRLNALADNAWSDIDVQLKRRHDLIPNIVEAVRGHAGFERETLERVVEARAVAMTARGPAARGEAESVLGQALGRLVALAESYPELKAGASYARLQEALVMVEDALQNARRYYNAVVRDLNTATQRFPSNLFARMLGFTVRDYFQLTSAGEGKVPDVQLPDR